MANLFSYRVYTHSLAQTQTHTTKLKQLRRAHKFVVDFTHRFNDTIVTRSTFYSFGNTDGSYVSAPGGLGKVTAAAPLPVSATTDIATASPSKALAPPRKPKKPKVQKGDPNDPVALAAVAAAEAGQRRKILFAFNGFLTMDILDCASYLFF